MFKKLVLILKKLNIITDSYKAACPIKQLAHCAGIEETFVNMRGEEPGDGCNPFNSKTREILPFVKIGAFCRK